MAEEQQDEELPGGDGDADRSGDVGDAAGGATTRVHGDHGAGPGSGQETRSGTGGRRRGGGEQRMVPKDKPRSYYDRPVVKQPVWTWEIPLYFFTGGLAGASASLGWAAGLRGNVPLSRRAWLVALAAVGASPALLISDLGRPERFLNMMRVFKITSPMSVGSWILAANGGVIAPAALAAFRSEPGLLLRASRPAAALAGPALSTYTAVLVANSAIPAWSEARRHLPFLFAGSSAASAGAAAALLTPAAHAGPARRLAVGGAAAELVADRMMDRSLGELAQPYKSGKTGKIMKAGRMLTAAGAALIGAKGRSRGAVAAGAAMVLAGSACARWGVYRAGFDSAADPSYTVAPQRDRLGGSIASPARDQP